MLQFLQQNLPDDADALTLSDEVEGIMRFVEFPGLSAGEAVVEELTGITLGETEEVWILLSDTATRAEEESCVLTVVNIRESCVPTVVNIRDLDGEGETGTVAVKEILGVNETDDEAERKADDGISKETEKKNKVLAKLVRQTRGFDKFLLIFSQWNKNLAGGGGGHGVKNRDFEILVS